MKLIETLSTILDMPVREGKLRQYVGILDREGRITKKIQLEILLALCEKISEIEKAVEPMPEAVSSPFFTTTTKELHIPISVDELKQKRQANMKKAQEARRLKYELKRSQAK